MFPVENTKKLFNFVYFARILPVQHLLSGIISRYLSVAESKYVARNKSVNSRRPSLLR